MGDRIQSELEYFHQKYGWNIEYKERAQPVMEALPTNNAEEHEQTDIAMEEEEDQTTRSQEDIASEIESVRTDIASKEHEKEELQNDINKAVASEQYEEAGKLAPKKKKLIAETKELKLRLEELEKEIANKIEEQEQEKEPHQDEVDENKEDESTNDKSAENIDPNEESLHGLNGIANNEEQDIQSKDADDNQIIVSTDEQPSTKIINEDEEESEEDTNMFADMAVDDDKVINID